jgi:hypothetical protein
MPIDVVFSVGAARERAWMPVLATNQSASLPVSALNAALSMRPSGT